MKTLDRYIIKQFLQNYIILCVVLSGLYVLVDLIVDLDEFLKAGREHADRMGGVFAGTAWVMADYYGPVLLLIFSAMSGLIVVAAMGFTISQLQRTRELTAILASGISLYRIAAPVLIAGFAINLLVLPVQELAIPPLADKLVRSKSQVGQPTMTEKPIHYARDESGALISASSFSAKSGDMTDVRIIERDDEGRQERLILADRATWSEGKAQGKANSNGLWLLENGQAFRTMTSDALPTALGGEVVTQYRTELSPEVLITRQAALYVRLQSIGQLQTMRSNSALTAEQRAQITQVMWGRFTTLVMGVLILLMGLPYFLTRMPGNMLISSAKAASITIGAWSAGLVLMQIGGLNPVTTALLPIALYVPISFYLISTIKT
ncbi:MAG: LptF/LptG family permease [Phycisphaeraceae bacterium]